MSMNVKIIAGMRNATTKIDVQVVAFVKSYFNEACNRRFTLCTHEDHGKLAWMLSIVPSVIVDDNHVIIDAIVESVRQCLIKNHYCSPLTYGVVPVPITRYS